MLVSNKTKTDLLTLRGLHKINCKGCDAGQSDRVITNWVKEHITQINNIKQKIGLAENCIQKI